MMKTVLKNFGISFFLLLSIGISGYAQSVPIDTAGFKTFSYQDGDTTYLMKQYYLCILMEGPVRDQGEKEAAEIQTAHLAHLSQLAADRKICMAGPFQDQTPSKGVLIFSTPTLEEATALANADPAVKAGRLKVVIHPWWAAIGSQLF